MIATARSTLFAFLAIATLAACTAAPTAAPPTASAQGSQPMDIVVTSAPPTAAQTESAALATPEAPPTLAALPAKVLSASEGLTSPDGKWRLRTLFYDQTTQAPIGDASGASRDDWLWNYYGQFVAATDGSVTHTIRAGWMPDGLGGPAPQTLGWSPDSQVAYVYTSASPDGCSVGGGISEDILRYDITAQKLQAIGSGPGLPTLSPDGKLVAYAGQTDPTTGELWLLDLASGGTKRWPFPLGADGANAEVGGVSLAPDGSAAVVGVHHDTCGKMWRNALVYIDLTTGEASEFLPAGTTPTQRTVENWLPDARGRPHGMITVLEKNSPMSGTWAPAVVQGLERP